MKYIRTINGRIIDLSDCELDDENEEYYYYIQHDDEYGYEIRKNNILIQADTIEELCDKFVLISGTNRNCNPFLITINTRIAGTKEVVFGDGSGHHSIAYHKKEGDEIYGAIWADKGLIYVAKMNEKGELELL